MKDCLALAATMKTSMAVRAKEAKLGGPRKKAMPEKVIVE
jgi:hypothetical protein